MVCHSTPGRTAKGRAHLTHKEGGEDDKNLGMKPYRSVVGAIWWGCGWQHSFAPLIPHTHSKAHTHPPTHPHVNPQTHRGLSPSRLERPKAIDPLFTVKPEREGGPAVAPKAPPAAALAAVPLYKEKPEGDQVGGCERTGV